MVSTHPISSRRVTQGTPNHQASFYTAPERLKIRAHASAGQAWSRKERGSNKRRPAICRSLHSTEFRARDAAATPPVASRSPGAAPGECPRASVVHPRFAPDALSPELKPPGKGALGQAAKGAHGVIAFRQAFSTRFSGHGGTVPLSGGGLGGTASSRSVTIGGHTKVFGFTTETQRTKRRVRCSARGMGGTASSPSARIGGHGGPCPSRG
jgi:hypothetical protein